MAVSGHDRQRCPRPWISPAVVRGKHPDADLKLAYPRALRISLAAAAACLGLIAYLFPSYDSATVVSGRIDPVIIIIDDIPETAQDTPHGLGDTEGLSPAGRARADTSGPAEGVDLDHLANLGLSVGMPRNMDLDEETVGFWAVSREPVLLEEIIPAYPQEARQAGLEGVVFVKFAVGSNGRVKKAFVLKGPEIFRRPALKAVYQFEFIPAMQNQRPVAVWMTLPIRFQLLDSYDPRNPPPDT